MTIWHNHRLKDDYTPVFPFADRIRLGDGVFDTMLAVEGSLIHAYEHFDRLLNNAKVMGMVSDKPISDLIDAARSVLKQGRLEEGRAVINTILSRGSGERGLAPPESADLQIVMRAVPAPDNHPAVEAIFSESVRRNEGSPLSRIKSANYGDNILAMIEAQDKGANEAILLNNKGFVTCATAANIFIVHGGKLYTPPVSDGVLPGIIRRKIMETFDAIEKSLRPEDLKNADGIYLTSSVRGVTPVEKLDGHRIPAPSLLIDKDFHLV